MDEALDKILVPGRPHHPRVDGPVVEINFVGVPSTKFLSPPPMGGGGDSTHPPILKSPLTALLPSIVLI
jgi:hypothetical protein